MPAITGATFSRCTACTLNPSTAKPWTLNPSTAQPLGPSTLQPLNLYGQFTYGLNESMTGIVQRVATPPRPSGGCAGRDARQDD
eukprot:364937-Chlamydomonas_euryale.AAC.31